MLAYPFPSLTLDWRHRKVKGSRELPGDPTWGSGPLSPGVAVPVARGSTKKARLWAQRDLSMTYTFADSVTLERNLNSLSLS